MAASNTTFSRRFTTAFELKFNQRLLWGQFTNTTFQVAAQGLDSLDIFLPDTSGIVSQTGTLIDGGAGANWASNTRNQNPLTARDITTERKRMFLRHVYRDSVKVDVDDLFDVPVNMVDAAAGAQGELAGDVVNDDLRSTFHAGIPATNPTNRTTVGSATQFCTITGANRGQFETAAGTVSADQSTIYEAIEYAQLTLRQRNIVDTGMVERTSPNTPLSLIHI